MLLVLIQSIQDSVVREKLTTLYLNYYEWLVNKARKLVTDEAVSEDIVHDVFLRLIQKDGKWKFFNRNSEQIYFTI